MIYPQLIYISHYHDVFIHCEGRFDLDENLCRQEMCKDACMNISAQGFIPIFIFIVFWGGSCYVGLCFLYQNETVMFRHRNNNLIEIFEKYV